MAYKITQGGHAPGDLREEFCEALEAYVHCSSSDKDAAEIAARLHTACGKLWNCSDVLPNDVRSDVDELKHWLDPMPNTYAGAARAIRYHLANAA